MLAGFGQEGVSVVRTPQAEEAPWRRDRWEPLLSRRDFPVAAAASVTIGGSGITASGADVTSERRAQLTEVIDRPVRGGELGRVCEPCG